MGWLFQHRDKGITNDEWFTKEFNPGTVIHASATVSGVYYAALEVPTNPGHVFAFMALTQWAPKDHYNFGYKSIGEDMGPGDALAPMKVIDALAPTHNTYALEWRDQCRHRDTQRSFMKKHLRDGDKVKLNKMLKFTSGTSEDTFTVSRVPVRGGKTKVILINQGRRYLIPNWRDLVVSIIRDGSVEIDTPLKARMAEDAYVEMVQDMRRAHPATKADIDYHYNVYPGEDAAWLVREKFRQEGEWSRLDELEGAPQLATV